MLDIANLYKASLSRKRSVMSHLVKELYSRTCHPRVYPQMERTTSAFAFSA